MARTRVIVRRNGRVVGHMTYGSEAEAAAHAAKMQGAASGLEALLAPASNRKPRRNGAAQLTAHQEKALRYIADNSYGNRYAVNVKRGEVGLRTAHALETLGLVTLEAHSGLSGRKKIGGFAGKFKGYEQKYVSDVTALLTPEGQALAVSLLAPKKNPSIGRGTKHRDIVAHAVEERLLEEGVEPRAARSRGYAIATASEKARRRGKVYVSRLRANPTPIDIASLDFAQFKKTVIIDTQYPTRSGRRFARVISKDGTFVTDVPISDGGISGGEKRVRGADAIKKRAWEQLRVHLKPSTWKPSVRVNPAGSVAYGGTSIRIAEGTYTVMPHGPSFKGPDGFVSAKRWVDTHGA